MGKQFVPHGFDEGLAALYGEGLVEVAQNGRSCGAQHHADGGQKELCAQTVHAAERIHHPVQKTGQGKGGVAQNAVHGEFNDLGAHHVRQRGQTGKQNAETEHPLCAAQKVEDHSCPGQRLVAVSQVISFFLNGLRGVLSG